MQQILLVEDDPSLGEGVRLALESTMCTVLLCRSLKEARAYMTERMFHLVILDIALPDGSGLDMLREIKRRSPGTPVMILTANDMEFDIVTGLEAGADDYVTKPFSLAVLRARVEVQLRRGQSTETTVYTCGPYIFDFDRLTFSKNACLLSISQTELKLLRMLVMHPGQILTRARLLEHVWPDGAQYVDENALSVTVKRLRSKLEDDPSQPQWIQTVYGIGYVWQEVQK